MKIKLWCKDCGNYDVKTRYCEWHGPRRPFRAICSDYKAADQTNSETA